MLFCPGRGPIGHREHSLFEESVGNDPLLLLYRDSRRFGLKFGHALPIIKKEKKLDKKIGAGYKG
jgi:hypothetical protein